MGYTMKYPVDKKMVAEHLAGMCKFPTRTHRLEEMIDFKPFDDMHEYMKEIFPLIHEKLEWEIVGRDALLYHWKGTGKSGKNPILFMAHQDVVPEGDPAAWKYPPYAGTIDENGRIWGRGAGDSKGNIVPEMEAVEYLLSIGYTPDVDIYLAYGYNEEVGSGLKEKSAACMIMRTLEKRGVRLEGVLDEGGGVQKGENFGITTANVATMGICEKGYADFEISRKDAGGHSSAPEPGGALTYVANAILGIENNPYPLRLSPAVAEKFRILSQFMSDPEQKRIFSDLEKNWAEAEPIIAKDRKLRPYFHTTMAISMARGSAQANVLPEYASVTVNCRILAPDTVDSVRAHIQSVIPEGMEITLQKGCDPSDISVWDSEFRHNVIEVAQTFDEKPIIPVPDMVVGGTDAKYFNVISDNVYRFIGFAAVGESGGAHVVDEYMDTDKVASAVDFFIDLIKKYEAK